MKCIATALNSRITVALGRVVSSFGRQCAVTGNALVKKRISQCVTARNHVPR